jgi:hypothetical protein
MKRLLSFVPFFPVAAFLLLFVAVNARAEDKAADVNGTWTWTTPGRNGGEGREQSLKLKAEGDKVTGALSGRRGNDTKIENGKISGNDLSFEITREFNGNSFTAKYKGKVSGDTITGKVEMQGRDGQPRQRDWTAKRKTEKKSS